MIHLPARKQNHRCLLPSNLKEFRLARSATRTILCAWALLPLLSANGQSEEISTISVEANIQGERRQLVGELLVEAADGGILLQTRDAMQWMVQPQDLLTRSISAEVIDPLTGDALADRMLSELPPGFEKHVTAHYAICFNTSRKYAHWCGGLYERLYLAFTNYWRRRGLPVREPRFPLPVIIFASRDEYAAYAKPDLGEAAGAIVAYYNLQNNRVAMYDLTGVESIVTRGRGERWSFNQLLAQPAAEPLVATIVHEATHQIAFNCGLQVRYTDVPLWVSEGLAIYFEAPDLQSRRGWRGIGQVNYRRLRRLRRNLPARNSQSWQALVRSDQKFRDTKTGVDAYADAWGLTYFLIHRYPREYQDYLRMLSEKPRMIWDDAATREREFQAHFPLPWERLDKELKKFLLELR